ncbi:hypothetical protein [Rhizobium sp. LjRoot254]|uniref:hypothetical protein n=1 Tax=Rhizobium sp. LjRoot254 TaxID=3342297 RepID=UPI003ED0F0BC
MTTIKATAKGELVLSKELLEAHGITGEAELEVSGGQKQIVLKLVDAQKAAEPKKTLTVEEFLARRPKYDGPPLTDEMINEAISREAVRRWNEKNSR